MTIPKNNSMNTILDKELSSVEDLYSVESKYNDIPETKHDPSDRTSVYNYIMDRVYCSSSCLYFGSCPYVVEISKSRKNPPCKVKTSIATFNSWYNICLGGRTGIENEMKKSLLQVYDSGDMKLYIDQSVKVLTALYGPDKSKRNDIPVVNLIVEPTEDLK